MQRGRGSLLNYLCCATILVLMLGLAGPSVAIALEKKTVPDRGMATAGPVQLQDFSIAARLLKSWEAARPNKPSNVKAAAAYPLTVVDSVAYDVDSSSLVQGTVRNDTAYPLFGTVYVTTYDDYDNVVESATDYPYSYYIRPGEVVPFMVVLSTQAWSTYDVSATGETLSEADRVHLTPVSGTVKGTTSLRTWTVQFRNDTAATVTGVIASGIEDDAFGFLDTVMCYDSGLVVQPGQTVSIDLLGAFCEGFNPFSLRGVQCEAASAVFSVGNVYRFRNVKNGYYLWTANEGERMNIVNGLKSTWTMEGVAYSINPDTNTDTLYRFRNNRGGFYLYTANSGEKNNIVNTMKATWTLEGPAYKVSNTAAGAPVWRFRNLKNGTYLLTGVQSEKDNIANTMKSTWILEGPAFYIAP